MDKDTITVLHACYDKRMTKLITPRAIAGYDNAKWFRHYDFDLWSIDDLSAVLGMLESLPGAVVIRGQPLNFDPDELVLRRKDAYDGELAYYGENPDGLHTMMADFDKLPTPPGLHPDDRLDYLVSKLPAEFHDVSFHYQWSSSSGLAKPGVPAWSTLSCHLWYWMETARCDSEMMRWAATQEIDDAVMRTVQPNYVARPIFLGVVDPFAGGGRSGFVKNARDAVPDFLIPPAPVYSSAGSSMLATALRVDLRSAFTDWHDLYRWQQPLLVKLADISVRLHMPIQKAIACAVGLYDDGLDWPALKTTIRDRIAISPHGEKHIYTSDAYLDASHRGAVAKFGGSKATAPLATKMINGFNWRHNRHNKGAA